MYGKINSTDKLCLKTLPCAPQNRTNPLTGKWEEKLLCENGGSCELSHLTNYYCKCQLFYTGKHCEEYDTRFGDRNPCKPHPCRQGLCRLVKDQSAVNPDSTPKAFCICPPGYKGENCQKRITPCDLSPFEEECNAALKAKRIDPRCGKSNETAKKCHNGGVCEEYSLAKKGFRCRCDVKPWIGEFCDVFDPCLVKDVCQNGSSCVSTISEDGTSMKALCICQPDSKDVKCSQLDPNACDKFKKNPCYYGGVCVKCHAQNSKGLHKHISPFCRTTDDFKRQFV
uniref:EGF-like domain-containing protein n=1 Tax=Romanomermis culicivorax TaxID=13658 RepID=A0A915IIQ9_ROMCU